MALRFLLDSDVCVAVLNGVEAVLGRWQAVPSAQVALCSVVHGELSSGAWGTRDPFGTLARFERVFGQYVSLPFDDGAAAIYGRVSAHLRRGGLEIGIADTMIAAIALAHHLTVVTRNLRHFRRVPDLDVVRW